MKISKFDSDRQNEGLWDELIQSVEREKISTPEELKDFLLPYEEAYMEEKYPDEKWPINPKNKNSGKFKFSNLPNKYRTAKSEINKAIEYGIDLFDQKGCPKSKTQLSEEWKKTENPIQQFKKILTQLKIAGKDIKDIIEKKEALELLHSLINDLRK